MLLLSIKKHCFSMSSEFSRSIENIKYCIKRHIASLARCVSYKLSPAYSLYSLK